MNRESGPPARGAIGGLGPRAGLLYRLIRTGCSLVARALFRVRLTGLEHIPRDADGDPSGGWIACGLPHRNWVEPLLMLMALPAEPRIVVLGDGPTMSRSWWRRLIAHWVGGLVPVWPASGARTFDGHVAAARRALAAGSVFAIFPEVGGPSPAPALRRVSPSIGYIALRTGAPVVPIVFGGTDELFLRRRIEVRVLPPVEAALRPPAAPRSERDAAHAFVATLVERVGPVAAAAHAAAQPSAGGRRRWRWLTGRYPRAD